MCKVEEVVKTKSVESLTNNINCKYGTQLRKRKKNKNKRKKFRRKKRKKKELKLEKKKEGKGERRKRKRKGRMKGRGNENEKKKEKKNKKRRKERRRSKRMKEKTKVIIIISFFSFCLINFATNNRRIFQKWHKSVGTNEYFKNNTLNLKAPTGAMANGMPRNQSTSSYKWSE